MKEIYKKVRSKQHDYVEAKRQENEPPKTVPRITNTTVPEHREEVLSSARKFIYPLQHSKHKIVLISISIFIITIISFLTFTTVSLYKLQSTSTFMYKVTQIVPFPIARVGDSFVAYENYLFELRRYQHYYETQQKLDFNSESGQQQLKEFKKRALDKVVNFAYIKDIAAEKKIKVTDQETEDQIKLLQEQNRLGNGDKVFEDVLQDYFGWSRDDFKRYLGQELLTQKVVGSLDLETQAKAKSAYAELKKGKNFSAVAKKYSDDQASKSNGGEIGFLVTRTNRDLTPIATDALFQLKAGQVSKIINTGYSLEIFKLLEKKGDKVKGAHILLNFKDVSEYTNDLKEKNPPRSYIPAP